MLPEEKVLIEDRYLTLVARFDNSLPDKIRFGLPDEFPQNSLVVFVLYAYADLPIGKTFEYVFKRHNPSQATSSVCKVVAVTQQFGKPFDEIPHGWNTISLLQFPNGIPEIVKNLPVAIDTIESTTAETNACISSEETWRRLVSKNR